MSDPNKRAKELHSFLENKITKNKVTIAVGNTNANLSLVGTSEGFLRKEIRNNLLEHEIIATPNPERHAEEDIIARANELNLTLTEIGASRAICLDCEDLLKENGVEAKTEFSGKKSKKRT
jgi:hypothetical protein